MRLVAYFFVLSTLSLRYQSTHVHARQMELMKFVDGVSKLCLLFALERKIIFSYEWPCAIKQTSWTNTMDKERAIVLFSQKRVLFSGFRGSCSSTGNAIKQFSCTPFKVRPVGRPHDSRHNWGFYDRSRVTDKTTHLKHESECQTRETPRQLTYCWSILPVDISSYEAVRSLWSTQEVRVSLRTRKY